MVCRTHILICLVLTLIWSNTVLSFEFLNFIGAAINKMGGCRFYECCTDEWIPHNFDNLEKFLTNEVFGQHIAQQNVIAALRGHFRQGASPKKALVLSFHGYAGSGKTFVSQFIRDSIYKLGSKSKYAHFFTGRNHFSVAEKVNTYKENLKSWIKGNVTNCPKSLFVFDDVHVMPQGILDALKSFLDFHEAIDGVDYRKTVFIFLSNTGSTVIAETLLDLWQKGVKRKDIKLNNFENLIRQGAFNEKGGFQQSDAIESDLIDHYIPFLPMEESHVRECIKAEFKRQQMWFPSEDNIKAVLEDLTFGPEPHNIYSTSGCKRIISKVSAFIERPRYDEL